MIISKTKTRELILEGNIYRVLFVISFPVVITNMLQALYELTDMFYVGKLGAMAIAALSLTVPINFLIMVFAMGMAIGSVSLMSKSIGEETFSKFSKYAGQLIFLNFVLSLFVTILVLIFIDFILDAMSVSGELKELTKTYFRVVIYTIPVMFLSTSFICILNAQGETILAMVLILVANIINFIIDPILMFTFGLGITGAAWSTLLSRLMTILFYFFLTYKLNYGLKIRLRDIIPNIPIIKNIISLGLPASFGQTMASLSFFIFNNIAIQIGPKFLAAYGMANHIISFLLLPGVSIGTGIITIIGQNLGAKNFDRIKDIFKKGFFITLVIMVFFVVSLICFRIVIIQIFTKDLEVFNYANNYLLVSSIGAIGFGLQQVFFGGFIGMGLTRLVTAIIFIRLWIIRLPAVFIFQYFGMLENSLGYAFTISNYVALIILLFISLNFRYWIKKW